LLAYTHAGWRWAGEPGRFVDNWHIECMCEHLEAVANRQILRLLINVPPRHYKSMGLNVFFPSWVWAQNPDPTGEYPDRRIRDETWMGPGVRFAYLSYDSELSTEHSIKCRELIESPWYQNHWGDRFQLTQNLKTHYNNDKGGQRLSGTMHGLTGFGANIFGYEDPHDLQNVESDVKRNEVLRFATEILPNRFNPEEPGALIVIMQRSRSRDLSGHIFPVPRKRSWRWPIRRIAETNRAWRRLRGRAGMPGCVMR
jgi:hypothetical protein